MTNITEHEWSDSGIDSVYPVAEGIISISLPTDVIHLHKSDAIAIAKHFGLLDEVNVPFSQINVTEGRSRTISSEDAETVYDFGHWLNNE